MQRFEAWIGLTPFGTGSHHGVDRFMEGRLNDEEKAETLRLLGDLLGAIHHLPTPDALAVMDVDDHMRRGTLSSDDLTRLRDITARMQG